MYFTKTFVLGNDVYSPGAPVGKGLSEKASKDLGLPVGLPVAASLIDAHAGGLGMFFVISFPLHSIFVRLNVLNCLLNHTLFVREGRMPK